MNNYNGFYKVAENGFGVTSAIFFNPETKEIFSKIVWDIDNDRLLEDDTIQILRYLPLDKKARWQYLRYNGVIQEGDTVEVVKGRKIAHGTKAVVKEIKPFYDKYHRWRADYLYFTDGTKTNKDNCILIV